MKLVIFFWLNCALQGRATNLPVEEEQIIGNNHAANTIDSRSNGDDQPTVQKENLLDTDDDGKKIDLGAVVVLSETSGLILQTDEKSIANDKEANDKEAIEGVGRNEPYSSPWLKTPQHWPSVKEAKESTIRSGLMDENNSLDVNLKTLLKIEPDSHHTEKSENHAGNVDSINKVVINASDMLTPPSNDQTHTAAVLEHLSPAPEKVVAKVDHDTNSGPAAQVILVADITQLKTNLTNEIGTELETFGDKATQSIVQGKISDTSLEKAVLQLDKILPLIPFKILNDTIWRSSVPIESVHTLCFEKADQIAFLAASLSYVTGSLLSKPESQWNKSPPARPHNHIRTQPTTTLKPEVNKEMVRIPLRSDKRSTYMPSRLLLGPFSSLMRISLPMSMIERLAYLYNPILGLSNNNNVPGPSEKQALHASQRKLLQKTEDTDAFLKRIQYGAVETQKYLQSFADNLTVIDPIWFEAADLLLSSLPSLKQDEIMQGLTQLDTSQSDGNFSALLQSSPVSPDTQSAALLLYKIQRALNTEGKDRDFLAPPEVREQVSRISGRETEIKTLTDSIINYSDVRASVSDDVAGGFIPNLLPTLTTFPLQFFFPPIQITGQQLRLIVEPVLRSLSPLLQVSLAATTHNSSSQAERI